MESLCTVCRGCLAKPDEPNDMIQYTEKNRRQFVYSTGLQVKRNDIFTFLLCKECYVNMKMSCKFRKQCRTSDKKFKNYLAMKAAGETVDFWTFLKNTEETFRFPFMKGSSTPMGGKNIDDDNESANTSICNFMTDMLKPEEIPDTEATIIREVIAEEADILDDSLDSQWLQDDMSIDTDFQLDFSLTPFSTPQQFNNDRYLPSVEKSSKYQYGTPKELLELHDIIPNKDTIDKNLEKALNNNVEMFALEDLIVSPADDRHNTTEIVNDILFCDDPNQTIENTSVTNLKNEQKVEFNCIEYIENGNGDSHVIENVTKPNDEESLATNKLINVEQYANHETDIYVNHVVEMDVKPSDEEILSIKLNFYVDHDEREKKDLIAMSAEKPVKLKEMPSDVNDEQENKADFYCAMCNIQFKNLLALKRHFIKSHKISLVENKKYQKNIVCDECGKIFNDMTNFKRHKLTHFNERTVEWDSYQCDICKLTYKTKSHLRQHILAHSQFKGSVQKKIDAKYVCKICGFISSTVSNLKTHQRRHTNNFTCHCSVCHKGYYRKCDLKIHMRTHTKEKPYDCKTCGMKFSRADNLLAHVRSVHTGERPYQCQHCKKSFPKSSTLTNHLRKSKTCKILRDVLVLQESKKGCDGFVSTVYKPVVSKDKLAITADIDQ